MEIIKKSKEVTVNDSEDYALTVKIGDGQKGSTSFMHPNGSFKTGDIQNEPLGNGASLKGKSLSPSSMVTDVNPHTNNVTITYLINQNEVLSILEDADENNGSVFFETTLKFI